MNSVGASGPGVLAPAWVGRLRQLWGLCGSLRVICSHLTTGTLKQEVTWGRGGKHQPGPGPLRADRLYRSHL